MILFSSVSFWISVINLRKIVGDLREVGDLGIISDQFLLLHVPSSRRSLQPPKVLVGHVTLKSISLPHRPQTHPIPLCHPPPSQHQLCHYVEPVMILSQHQIQTLLTAYHLQTSSAVQKAKCISGDVSDWARLMVITVYPRSLTLSINSHRLVLHKRGSKTNHIGRCLPPQWCKSWF